MLEEERVVAMLVFLASIVLVLPIVRYYTVGWFAKRSDIMEGQSEAARKAYFDMFCRAEAKTTTDLDVLYNTFYGRHLFLLPTFVLILVFAVLGVIAIGSTPALKSILTTLSIPEAGINGQAAVAGAYMWVVNDFIWRARRLDFSPADVHWATLRLAVSIPMGYSLANLVPARSEFIAFALGAFPLSDIMILLRRGATKYLGFEPEGDAARDNIVKLQGINWDILERLANEDIATITQIAYCDPIRLAMRSNLSFNFITDLMNQALAWVYIEGRMEEIRCFGLKGAVEIKHIVDEMRWEPVPAEAPEKAAKNLAEKNLATSTFQAAAAKLGIPEPTLMNTFREIVDDPFTVYLYTIWD